MIKIDCAEFQDSHEIAKLIGSPSGYIGHRETHPLRIKSTPGSLGEVLDALEKDHEWLLRGDVFTRDVVETWIKYKREREVAPVSHAIHSLPPSFSERSARGNCS